MTPSDPHANLPSNPPSSLPTNKPVHFLDIRLNIIRKKNTFAIFNPDTRLRPPRDGLTAYHRNV